MKNVTETKNEFWQMRADQTDRENFAKLQKQLGVRSQAEAVRFAVTMAIRVTEPRPDQSPTMQATA